MQKKKGHLLFTGEVNNAFTTHLATCQAPPSIEAGHSTTPLTTSHSEETSDLHFAPSDIEIPMSSAPLAELPSYHSTPYLEPLKIYICTCNPDHWTYGTNSFTVVTRDQQVPFFELRRGHPELIPSTQYPNTYITFDLAVNFIFIANIDPVSSSGVRGSETLGDWGSKTE
ncbi:hypothetical protein P691DRAFT_789743 [Macrolepiota fuliginosa MF-IS2]|uniref:Uncharacterized protein n=1 Tax=Macrolepiota fuliginosa MF-IS2 TaxID=1400762 RepID=A0A9P6BVY8_9AGAR|nr:hypothetical protein P691DRAFT_789743 [Macrolepiota fuliginosa MF-IS2]